MTGTMFTKVQNGVAGMDGGVRHGAAEGEAAGGPDGGSVEAWIAALKIIDDALGRARDVASVPCDVILRSLPPALRGPRWGSSPAPQGIVELDSWELLEKIRSGRVVYRLDRIRPDLPAGWTAPGHDDEVELDPAALEPFLPSYLVRDKG